MPEDPCFHTVGEGPTDLLVLAGEASGDEHAANLVETSFHSPQLKVVSMGGLVAGN